MTLSTHWLRWWFCALTNWTSAGIFLIESSWQKPGEISIGIQIFLFTKIALENVCKMSSLLSRPQCEIRCYLTYIKIVRVDSLRCSDIMEIIEPGHHKFRRWRVVSSLWRQTFAWTNEKLLSYYLEGTSIKIYSQFQYFHWRNCIITRYLENDVRFIQVPMCWIEGNWRWTVL